MVNDKKFNPHFFQNTIKSGIIYHVETELTYQQVYKELSTDFPESVVERTKASVTKRGYDTTGLKSQAIVDRLNDVLTPWGWGYKVTQENYQEEKTASGRRMWECNIDLEITVLGAAKTHTGGHTAFSRSDAKKGAITNGLKKCAAMFGIGRQAYLGTLDDDNLPVTEARQTKSTPAPEQKAVTFSETEIQGACWLGKESKGKKWNELTTSTLNLIADFKKDPKGAAIALEVLRRRHIDASLELIKKSYNNDEKYEGTLRKILGTVLGGKPLYSLNGQQLTFLSDELAKMNDGMSI